MCHPLHSSNLSEILQDVFVCEKEHLCKSALRSVNFFHFEGQMMHPNDSSNPLLVESEMPDDLLAKIKKINK